MNQYLRLKSIFITFCCFLSSLSGSVEGISGIWITNGPVTNNWNVAANWNTFPAGAFPNGAGEVAGFIVEPTTANEFINLGTTITVGTLDLNALASIEFGNTTSAPLSLTFQGSATKPTANIFVKGGIIDAMGLSTVTYLIGSTLPTVHLASPLEIYGHNTSLLEIDANIQGAQSLTYSGRVTFETQSGTLILSGSNTYTGLTRIDSGAVNLQPFSANQVGGPAIPADLLINSHLVSIRALPTATYRVLNPTSNVTMLGGLFEIIPFIPTVPPSFVPNVPFNSLTINQSGFFTETPFGFASISLLSNTTPLNIGSGALAVSQLNLPNGGNITYQTNISNGSERGQAFIFNSGGIGIGSSITVDLGGNAVNIDIPHAMNPVFDMDFDNAIIQNGSLTKIGFGNLLFSGTGSIPALTVNAGRVLIGLKSADVIATTGPIQIHDGAILSGSGTLGDGTANVTNGGIVAPRDLGLRGMMSPLNIAGNYTQTDGGTLHITAVDNTTFTQLVIKRGGVILNGGTLIFETLPGNAIKAGDSFVVIDNAEGTGITGEFATLDAILPSNLTAFIQYTSNQVIVVIAQSNCLPCAIQDCFCPPLLSSSIT